MINDPLTFSIVIASYNASATIERAIESVSTQSWPYRQLIVIDGGSTDGTVDILKRRDGDIASWVSERDQGIYDAFNKGVLRATGQWICFLGADDYLWSPDVLERFAHRLSTAEDTIRVAYGMLSLVDMQGRVVRRQGLPWQREQRRFLQGIMKLPHPGMMHRREVFAQRGSFDTSFRIAGDYEFLLRELPHCPPVFFPEIMAVGMSEGGTSHAMSHRFSSLRENRRAMAKNGITEFPCAWYISWCRNALHLLLERILGSKGSTALINRMNRLKVGLRGR